MFELNGYSYPSKNIKRDIKNNFLVLKHPNNDENFQKLRRDTKRIKSRHNFLKVDYE